jgi:hypothetical protein
MPDPGRASPAIRCRPSSAWARLRELEAADQGIIDGQFVRVNDMLGIVKDDRLEAVSPPGWG